MGKNVSLNQIYTDRVKRLREKLGVPSDSEVVRRGIDELAAKFNVFD